MIVYSCSPADLPKPTTLNDVERDLFQDRDIRDERQLASRRPDMQAFLKDREAYFLEVKQQLSTRF